MVLCRCVWVGGRMEVWLRMWGGFTDEHEYTVLLLICNGGVYNTV